MVQLAGESAALFGSADAAVNFAEMAVRAAMGTSIEKVYTARALADIGLLPAGALIVDLGAQNFNGGIDPIKLENTLANFLPEQTFSQEVLDQIAGRASLKEIFSLLGFDYRCIDAYETEAGIVLDLNQDPTPEDLRGAVDIVQNFGTTEHVLNQTNCFTMIHEMTKPGGIMWHALPMSDFYTHGFFKYDIVFFIALARSNNYEIKEMTFGKSASAHPIPEFLFENGLPRIEATDTSMSIMLKKMEDEPFKIPSDVDAQVQDGPLKHLYYDY